MCCDPEFSREGFKSWLKDFEELTDGRGFETIFFWFEATFTEAMGKQIVTGSGLVDVQNSIVRKLIAEHNVREGSLKIQIIPTYDMFEEAMKLGLSKDGFHLKEEIGGFSAVQNLLNVICSEVP